MNLVGFLILSAKRIKLLICKAFFFQNVIYASKSIDLPTCLPVPSELGSSFKVPSKV